MAMTEFGVNHALAVKLWSKSLAVEAEVKQYFRKFMGTGEDSLIQVKTELTKAAGDRIRVGLQMKLGGAGIQGDNIIEGTSAEEALIHYYCDVLIDQQRKGTKSKGKMSEQRVPYDMRRLGRDALAVWWAEQYDQEIMMYLAGSRGIDTSFHDPLGYTGRASNTITGPESTHHIYAGNATGVSSIDSSDKMKLDLVEKLIIKAETVDPMMQPFMIEGEKKFVLLMHPYQAFQLRTSISQGDWLEIHKATDDAKSPIYKNALGEYSGVILHKHRNVIRLDETLGTSGSTVDVARALFLGAQAGLIAWGGGSSDGRYSWNEETDDRGNALAITAGAIYGIVKTIYNSLDFSVIAVDTFGNDPTA